MVYIGIDTSAYTTSLAAVDEQGKILLDLRRILNVPKGETGLAQSAAFFQHVQNFPLLVNAVPEDIWSELEAVGVSETPRPVEGSYMPVFTAGYMGAHAIAVAKGVPLFRTSHQEGHIAAGLASSGEQLQGEEGFDGTFLAIHISGGTTELLKIHKQDDGKMKIELIGGTTDLHAGQFVDRVGVRLGLPFPCGKQLEILAAESAPGAASLLPSSVKGLEVSFSGVETAAVRLLERGIAKADIARAVEGCIARTISKLINKGIACTGVNRILIVGGVAANTYLRAELAHKVKNARLYWAKPNLSSDNAVGIALLTGENRHGII